MDEAEAPPNTALNLAVEELRHLKRLLSRALAVLNSGMGGKVFGLGPEAQTGRRELRRLGEELQRVAAAEIIEHAEEAFAHIVSDAKLRYKENLELALRAEGIQFSGEWPSYLLNNVLSLRVDLADEVVSIGKKHLRSLDLARALLAIRRSLKDLLSRPFNPSEFSELVTRAYNDATASRELRPEDYVQIKSVFHAVKRRYGLRYSVEQFAVDLYRLLEAIAEEQVSIELDLSPARSPATGILIPGPNRGHISGIRVRHRGDKAC